MKRWGVCKILVDGNGDNFAAIFSYPVNARIIHLGSQTWVVCQFAASDLTAISADANIKILPDITLDSLWSSLNSAARNKAINELQSAGFQTTAIKTTSTLREILNYLGRQIDASFNCEAGDVKDLP